MRYVVNRPLGWTLGSLRHPSISGSSSGLPPFLLRERDHVAFTMVFDAVQPPARRVLAVLGVLAIGAAFVAGFPAMLSFITFMKIDVTPVTRIRFDYVYSIWIVFAVAVILRSAVSLARLAGRNWRREIGDAAQQHPTPAPTE